MAKNIKYIFLFLFVPFLLCSQNYPVKFDHISRKEGLPHSKINYIFKDSDGFMWFATQSGLCRYDGYSFKTFQPDPYNPKSLSHSYIWTIEETVTDSGNFLWIGTMAGGLCKFDKKHESFTTFKHDRHNPNSISNGMVRAIIPNNDGKMWIGTTYGLDHFDPVSGACKHFRYNPNKANCLSNNDINVLLRDKRGLLWIGTENGGLNCFDPAKNIFVHFKNDPLNPYSLSNDCVWSLCEDSEANLWIGTKNGLNSIDLERLPPDISSTELKNLKFQRFMQQAGNNKSLSGPWVLSILENESGQLWIATYGEGLNLYDKSKGEFFHYKTDPSNSYSLGNEELKYLLEDREQDILWIGTAGDGIYKYSMYKNRFSHFYHKPNDASSLSKTTLLPILEDHDGKIWIGTISKGIEQFDPMSGRFTHFTYDTKNPYSLPNNQVHSLYEDRHQNLWVGTANGLARYDPINNRFINFSRSDQKNRMSWVHEICEETNPNDDGLWVASSGVGLVNFRYQKNEFRVYNSDLNNDSTLSTNLIITLYPDPDSSSRTIWVGTERGLNKFDIENEQFTRYLHDYDNPFSISNNQVFPVHRDKSGVLWIGTHGGGLNRFDEEEEKFYHYTKEDGLPDNHVIGILEDGQGNLWLSTFKGLSRFDPTNETFINFDSRDGLQSDQFSVWSYHQAKNGLMYCGGINGFNVFHPDSIRLNPYVPSVKITDFRLFHQSVIPGPKSTLKKSILNTEQITLSNAFKFTPEGGKIAVDVSIIQSHLSLLPQDSGRDRLFSKGEIDPSPLSRGCKIPNPKFPIPNSDFIEIIISNTGPGIPPDQLDKIFDRFYQVDDSNTRHHDGTGIGLALTKELVELHHGTITVSTDMARHVPTDSLTIFTIHLPTGRDHLTDDEIVGDETIGDTRQDVYLHETDRPTSYEAHADVTVLTSNSKTIANQHKPIILIVEDHAEVRGYIKGILRDEYRIIQAEDGGKGLKIATEKQPDLILSDVMMPQMDGFEFCRRIKEDHQTSHIPVILLTARAGQEDRLEGLETGADDYLTKPFDARELQVRVQNLIQQRRNLKERFSQDPNSPVEMLAPTTLDRNFLHKALGILKAHLMDSRFDAVVLSREIGMSRSQLYRKLHALTGHSVSSFIRLYRLKQAARFLRKDEDNVSQICYDVGFSNPSYFSECFRKQFGVPPSQYARQANQQSVRKDELN